MVEMEQTGLKQTEQTKIDENGPDWTKMDPIDQSGTK